MNVAERPKPRDNLIKFVLLPITMNRLDKSVYTSLKFFANNTRKEVEVIQERKKRKYENKVPKDMNVHLGDRKFINPVGQDRYIITDEGLVELRTLEAIKHRGWALILSITAIIISVITFVLSRGWIKWG